MFCTFFVCFSPYLGVFWGGHPGGLGHNLHVPFSSFGSSKMEIYGTDFFYILTIHNDQISYVKYVIDPIHVLFTLFGCLDVGKGLGHTTCLCSFPLLAYENRNFQNRCF